MLATKWLVSGTTFFHQTVEQQWQSQENTEGRSIGVKQILKEQITVLNSWIYCCILMFYTWNTALRTSISYTIVLIIQNWVKNIRALIVKQIVLKNTPHSVPTISRAVAHLTPINHVLLFDLFACPLMKLNINMKQRLQCSVWEETIM